MRIAFFSNFLNHHQLAFCQEMIKIVGEKNFYFIACSPFDVSRLKSGYEDMNSSYPWVIKAYQNEDRIVDVLKNFDVVITIPELPSYNSIRLKSGKLTFFTSERLLKRGYLWRWNPIKIWRTYSRINKFKKDNLYVLCCGAYVAYDYIYSGFPKNRYFTWAYLPEVREEFVHKCNDQISLLWVGRLIEWKKPLDLLEACEILFSQGFKFKLSYIGDGPLVEKLKTKIRESKYSSNIQYVGSLKNENVLNVMKQSSIFVATSDRHEGWGAVVNEAMASGCCVIASDAMGSAPILIKDYVNGLKYRSVNIQDLSEKIQFCLKNPEKLLSIQKQAELTMKSAWNSAVAAKRFLILVNYLLGEQRDPPPYEDGLCSPACVCRY